MHPRSGSDLGEQVLYHDQALGIACRVVQHVAPILHPYQTILRMIHPISGGIFGLTSDCRFDLGADSSPVFAPDARPQVIEPGGMWTVKTI
ncbi:MAG: hypothetical protein OHK0039_15400 [Bacteroidia bacterium]